MAKEERNDVIKQIFKMIENGKYGKLALDTLEQTRWTPCSERPPEKSGLYWCTFGGTNTTGKDYYLTESDAKELFGDPEVYAEYAGWSTKNVVAWMHLPRPYDADITEKWITASQSASVYEKAYREGYYDAMEKLVKSAEWVDDKCTSCGKGIEDLITSSEWYQNETPRYCPFCGVKLRSYKMESEGKGDKI